jgi:acyl-CoA synthetase (AMP-forming)/AMP-acid ligase II
VVAADMLETGGIERVTSLTFERILVNASWPENRPALVSTRTSTNWGEFPRLIGSLERDFAGLAGRRVGLMFRLSATCLAALALLDRLGCDTFLIDASLQRDIATRLGGELRLGAVLLDSGISSEPSIEHLGLPDERPGSGQTSITILTSGTTGAPKAARHTWMSLSRPVRIAPGGTAQRWLMTFRPHLYAGLQVILQCLGSGGTLVAPTPDVEPAAIAELMRSARVEYASATPSYWRRLLMFADPMVLGSVPLIQVTLGGEVVDQQILDALCRTFSRARVTHIYATTEVGRCFSVTDGRAGFPARYLTEPTPDGVLLRVEDGELVVRSANAMEGYELDGAVVAHSGQSYPTGDLVEVVDDRAYFVGRRTDVINVGGNKVRPIEVERVLRDVSGVADARVFGRRSTIAGELVACQIVPLAGADTVLLRQRIVTSCLARLAAYQRPRLIDFVTEIALEDSGKVSRKSLT